MLPARSHTDRATGESCPGARTRHPSTQEEMGERDSPAFPFSQVQALVLAEQAERHHALGVQGLESPSHRPLYSSRPLIRPKRKFASARWGTMDRGTYVGTDILKYHDLGRTMNFGWDLATAWGRATALHEIGHTLGLPHEHQNPRAAIVWNEARVYEHFSGEPNCWDREPSTPTSYASYAPPKSRDRIGILNRSCTILSSQA